MNDLYSFYQLISKYQIEIPIIQRDYAQGRDNAKAADVRKSLIENMIKAAKGISPLFFDFVYGRIDGSKFIPFDGQQRLTTLFLFHKYVFEKCQLQSDCRHKENCICRDILKRFSYATRQSSREFCELLVGNRIIPTENYVQKVRDSYKKKLKDTPKEKNDKETENEAEAYIKQKSDWMHCFIANQPWFFPDWEKDPTVFGMMTMLDEIHNQLKDENNFKCMAERLTSGCNCPITFHFVDMGEHKLSDETYVKMNARGKQLTPFENFKASLEQYLEGKNLELFERFKGRFDEKEEKYTGIDGTWLDLFWNVVNQGKNTKELPDTMMMSFINRHFMNVWRCWYANNSKSEDERKNMPEEEKIKQIEYDYYYARIINDMPLYPTKDDFVSWDIYEHIMDYCDIENCLTPVFNIWDVLYKNGIDISNSSQSIWNRGKTDNQWNLFVGITYKTRENVYRETYPSRIAFYALLKFFKTTMNYDPSALSKWMRVVWNIIENSTIDSSEPYHAALRLIDKLSSRSHDIYKALANDFVSFNLGSQYHAQEQVEEEVVKASKINEDVSWEKCIEDAEKCPCLTGKIWVLFQQKDNTTLDHFKQRQNLLNSILNDSDEYYLAKILISYYDEKQPNKQINLKKDNWKSLLTNKKDGLFECFQRIPNNMINPNIKHLWIKDIATTQLLNYSRNDAKIVGKYRNSIVLWGTSGCKRYVFSNEVWGNVIIGNHRTLLVDLKMELQNPKTIVHNTSFISYFDVNFKYKENYFQWYGAPDEKELDVYLMEKDWSGYKSKGDLICKDKPDEYNYFCFRVTSNTTPDEFCQNLDRLIALAYPNESETQVCDNCQNKICEQTE